MGCDVHGTVEIKGERGWHMIFHLSHMLGRSYYMFGELFGVRGDGHGFFADRGIPDDADYWTKRRAGFTSDREKIGMDFHSDSYFLASEIKNIKDIEITNEYDDLFRIMKSLGEKHGMKNCAVWFGLITNKYTRLE